MDSTVSSGDVAHPQSEKAAAGQSLASQRQNGEEIAVSLNARRGDFLLDVNFTIPGRGITALFGPSGSGKTMILRAIAGLERMDGIIRIHGDTWQDHTHFCPPHHRRVGYVFQDSRLFEHLSVDGNLRYGQNRRARGRGDGVLPLSYDEVVHLLGMEKLLHRGIAHLSGGERQRVAVARALLSSPDILLMDEPLAALDQQAKDDILPYLLRLHDRLEVPVIYVSHDRTEMEMLADQIVLLDTGSVTASGPVAALLSRADLPFAMAGGAAVIIDGRVAAYDESYGVTTLQAGTVPFYIPADMGPSGTRRRLRIRATDVALCQPPVPAKSSVLNMPLATVVDMAFTDRHHVTVFLKIGDGTDLLARITRKSWDQLALSPGDSVYAMVKAMAIMGQP